MNKIFSISIILFLVFGSSCANTNEQSIEHTFKIVTDTNGPKTINVLSRGFEITQANKIDSMCLDLRMKSLITDVAALHNIDTIIFIKSVNQLDLGGYDPSKKLPTIYLNSAMGLTSSNIAHELFHAIQSAHGIPTVPKLVFPDKRQTVLKDLWAIITHIQLAKEITARGFSTKDYLQPTMDILNVALFSGAKDAKTKLSYTRAHYEAVVCLRIFFEANYLNKRERQYYLDLYRKKAPIALLLARKIVAETHKYDTDTWEGCVRAMIAAIEVLNKTDLRNSFVDYVPNAYSIFSEFWRSKYSSILVSN